MQYNNMAVARNVYLAVPFDDGHWWTNDPGM